MSPRRSTRAAALAAAAATALALTACAPQQAQSGASTASNAKSGVVTVGLPGSISTLDPAKEAGILNYYVAQVSSEGLLSVSATGELQPAIAQSYEAPDALNWVFEIRQDAKFQDGNPVTMDDVLFSLDLAMDAERSPSTAVYWPQGTTVAQTGDWEVTITLPSPAVNFGWTVSSDGGLWITEKSYYEKAASYGSAQDLIMGTGPYRATEFAPDSHATFEKVDTWWGGDVDAQTIEFDFFSDENTRLLAAQSGDIDIAVQVPAAQYSQYEKIDGVDLKTESDRSYVGLTFDANVAPFDDEHVRKAIAHAVDRESIVDTVLQGRGEVATGLEPPDQLGSEIGEDKARDLLAGLTNYTYDLDAAKSELAQSSVPDGFEAELTYPNSIPAMGTAALAIAAELKKIGIDLTVTEKPIEEWISKVGTGEYGLYYMSYTSTTGDAAEIPGWLLGDPNPAQYVNAEVQDLIAKSNAETDPMARAEEIIRATDIAQADVAYSPIWWGESTTSFGPRVSANEFTSYFFMTQWAAALTVD